MFQPACRQAGESYLKESLAPLAYLKTLLLVACRLSLVCEFLVERRGFLWENGEE